MIKRYYNSTTFQDVLFNTLLGFILLFVLAFVQINPDARKAEIESPAEMVITLKWDKNLKSDIDLWVEDPDGRVVYYRNKESGFLGLDRDDLGDQNDTVTVNGMEVVHEYNQEVVSIRGFVPGEYVVNVHFYNIKDPAGTKIPVTVRIDDLNPTFTTVFTRSGLLEYKGQQVTMTRFTLNANGDILGWSDLPKSLIKMDGSGSPWPVTPQDQFTETTSSTSSVSIPSITTPNPADDFAP